MARKHRFEDTAVWKYCDLGLTFQGHPRSKVMRGNESWHMTSYQLSIVTIWLGSTVLKIQLFEDTVTLIWPFKVIQGQRSWKIFFSSNMGLDRVRYPAGMTSLPNHSLDGASVYPALKWRFMYWKSFIFDWDVFEIQICVVKFCAVCLEIGSFHEYKMKLGHNDLHWLHICRSGPMV